MNEQFYSQRGMYYRTNKFTESRPTIVFIHGLSGSSSAWKKYEEKFRGNYNILSFDLRGHGKSAKPAGYAKYAMKHFTDDLHALLEHLTIKRVVLISHSFATLIALDFLKHYPERVQATVFLSPSYSVGDRLIARLLKPLFMLSRALGIFPFSGKPGTHVDYTHYLNTGDWNIPRMIADVGNTSLRVYLYCTLQSYTANHRDALKNITVPTLLIHGTKDTIFPVENSLYMVKTIPNAQLVLIPNTDHIVVLNNFPEVSRALENFLRVL